MAERLGWLDGKTSEKEGASTRRSQLLSSGFDLNPLRWGVEQGTGGYLLEAMQNIGWCGSSGFGPEPLSWAEIKAYADCSGDLEHPWEFQTLRDMSAAYIRGYNSDQGAADPVTQPRYADLHMEPLVHVFDRDAARVLAADNDALTARTRVTEYDAAEAGI